MSTRLHSISLENFRGFHDRAIFELDGDVVIVRGDNGTGKSSLTDGILWTLTGSLEHLTDRVRGLRRTEDVVTSRFAPERPATVTLTLNDGERLWRISRTGDSRRNELLINGASAQESSQSAATPFGYGSDEELTTAFTTWGMLRQDAIRSVLDSGATALHERMAAIIGLSEVTRFQEACREAANRHAQLRRDANADLERLRRIHAEAQDEYTRAIETRSSAEQLSVADRISSALEAASGDVLLSTEHVNSLDDLSSLGRSVASLIDAASEVASTYATLIRLSASIQGSSLDLEQRLATAQDRAETLDRSSSAAQRLAESALEQLGETCPVCGQAIDPTAVRAHLEENLEASRDQLAVSAELRGRVSEMRQSLVELRALEEQRSQFQEALQEREARFLSLLGQMPTVALARLPDGHESYQGVVGRLEEIRGILRQVYADASAELEADVERLSAKQAAALSNELRAIAAFEERSRQEALARQLRTASQSAADRIVARWLKELEPSFAEVFDRLEPHPAFSRLYARQDVYYNKNQIVPEVVDPVTGAIANPLLVFSEGQLNTVAISYFLGMVLNSPTDALGFMVLDDPLQSMDVIGVLGFADMCRRLRSQKQLLLTTHDRRYGDLLVRKLSPKESEQTTIVHEFSGWTRSGPQLGRSHRVSGSALDTALG